MLIIFMFIIILLSKNSFLCRPEDSDTISIFDHKFYFPDLPNGLLTEYRKQATFDYKKVALIMEKEESYKLRVSTYRLKWYCPAKL